MRGSYLSAGLILLVLPCCSGCMIPVLELAADTVLHVATDEDAAAGSIPMGFAFASFGRHAGQLLVTATGLLPDEHRTHIAVRVVGIVVDPIFDRRRSIKILMPDPASAALPTTCRIMLELGLGRSGQEPVGPPDGVYRGEAPLVVSARDRDISIDLQDVRLDRMDGKSGVVRISGRVRARQPLVVVGEEIEAFEKRWHEAPPAGSAAVPVPDGVRYETTVQE